MAGRLGRSKAAVVTVEHLHKAWGPVVAGEDISLVVEEGGTFGLPGPNGAGTATTLECLQGRRRADSGERRVLGLDAQTQGRELPGRVGFRPRKSAVPDRLEVWEALDLLGSPAGGAAD